MCQFLKKKIDIHRYQQECKPLHACSVFVTSLGLSEPSIICRHLESVLVPEQDVPKIARYNELIGVQKLEWPK